MMAGKRLGLSAAHLRTPPRRPPPPKDGIPKSRSVVAAAVFNRPSSGSVPYEELDPGLQARMLAWRYGVNDKHAEEMVNYYEKYGDGFEKAKARWRLENPELAAEEDANTITIEDDDDL